MKQLVLAALMCLAAMSAKAQVLTSETVKNVHNELASKAKSDYVYNVDYTDNDITTMYVYKKDYADKDILLLKPYLKYDYTYASDGTLTNKVTYHWDSIKNCWTCATCHDYAVTTDGKYIVEYSRYNPDTDRFDQPSDRMVYSLIPYNGINSVSSYHREDPMSQFQLVGEMQVMDMPVLYALQ